jgi:insulysin
MKHPNRTALALLLIPLLVALASCATAPPVPSTDGAYAPVQSPNDSRAYRLLTLDNGLKALLISDVDTPKAAASLDVHVGSGDNPEGRGGLAHFLEHMLFLGTAKYPDPAEYERFLTEHGGTRNAYTAFENTNYFFDVDAQYLPGALDRFAQFFIAPKFDARYVERERNAVEAEYQMGLNSDPRRGLDVLQATMNPDHPFSQFAVGSLESLADRPGSPVRDELIEFYREHYSANIMRLVVLGSESLDELETLVRDRFSAVPNREVPERDIGAPLFLEAQLPMHLRVEPTGTLRQLQVNFPIADYRREYDAKPTSYVSNLLGHEGEGSLLSQLKREGLADGLAAGGGLAWRGGALLSVSISLTERGVDEQQRVLQLLFTYLDMLRDAGPRERLYREQASIAELAFRFREPTAPVRYVTALSSSMHDYADEDILRGPYLMRRFDPEMIAELLDDLRPERAQVILTAPGVATAERSPYYDVPYARRGPEAIMLSQWRESAARDALHLPEPNPFIAEDTSLLALAEDNPATPALRHDSERLRIWYRQAEEFRVPRGALYVSFRSPQVASSATERAAAALYTRIVTDALGEYTYPALLAGLGFDFYRHSQGISLRVSGYNDKQLDLLQELLAAIDRQVFEPARFERIRREMVLELDNRVARRPTSQLLDDLRRALVSGEYSEAALKSALQDLDVTRLQDFRERFWTSARAEAMLFGNYPQSAVDDVARLLAGVLEGDRGEAAVAPEVLALPAGAAQQLVRSIDHADAVVAWYLQGAGQSIEDRALLALTAQATRSGFFQELRTEQQLGYSVSSFPWSQYDVPGMVLLVQSPSHDAGLVYERMQRFVEDLPAKIDAQQFARHRQALVNRILKPHENLGERAEFYWQAIAFRDWSFDEPQRLAAAVQAITYEQWLAFYARHLLEKPRSLLAVAPGERGVLPAPDDAMVFRDPETLRAANEHYRIDLSPL